MIESKLKNKTRQETIFLEVLSRIGIKADAMLMSESTLDAGRRVYKAKERIYKIILRHYESTSAYRHQKPEGEYKILASLSGCPDVPQEVSFLEHDDYYIVSYKYFEGSRLNLIEYNIWRFVIFLWNLKNILYLLSKHGVCHNDIKEDNIIVNDDGDTYIVDFDQATRSSFVKALLSNYVGWNKMSKTHSSFLGLIRSYFEKRIPPTIADSYKRAKNSALFSKVRHRFDRLQPLPESASERLRNIYNAWEIARCSNANSPGNLICYYSLDFEGFHLPGERPWLKRWKYLREFSDVTEKRVLELGCNLSLLSCHFLMAGATEALCVDKEADILVAAKKVAAAYGVHPTYLCVDFDASEDWESKLSSFRPDIVTALSVLNWIEDKERFLSFLARFDEVLFEGHESEDIERKRLTNYGFKHVKLIAVSERNRPVLYGHK